MGGGTGGSGARATVLPPLLAASRKRDRQLAAKMTTMPPSTTTSHATMCWSMLWSEGEIHTPHLPRPHLLRLARLSPQVLPECLLVLVSCVHVPMPHPHADGLLHDAVRTRIVVESAAVVMPQPSPQDHRQVLHQDHRSMPTVLAPNEYHTVMVRGDTGPGQQNRVSVCRTEICSQDR